SGSAAIPVTTCCGLRALETRSKSGDEVRDPRLGDDRCVQSHHVMDLEISAEGAPTERRITDDPERLLSGTEQDDPSRIEPRPLGTAGTCDKPFIDRGGHRIARVG